MITGGVTSATVTLNVQVAELLEASVIFQVTTVTPLLKNTPFSELATTLVAVVTPLKL